jgi:general secretion pathway protein A
MTAGQREALAYLTYGIRCRKGILVLTGEVGVGKTLIVRTLLSQLDESVQSALVMDAMLPFTQLLRLALLDFGLKPKRGKLEMLLALQEFLLDLRSSGRNAVMVIDEAQNLTPAGLEEVRLLSNLETPTEKLLQIVLVGQPELKVTLNSHRLRQLRQRIPGLCELPPLAAEGVGEYVEHRVRVASEGRAARIFDDDAVKMLIEYSQGIPRLINTVCDRALLLGYVNDQRMVGGRTMREAIDEITRGFQPGRRTGESAMTGAGT